MNPNRLKKTVMASLIGALGLWLAVDRFLPGMEPVRAEAAESVASVEPPDASEEIVPVAKSDDPEIQRERDRWTQAPWPADPFNRDHRGETAVNNSNNETGTSARHALTAIVTGRRPLALIDGAYLTVGDKLPDGSRIEAIGSNSVALQGPEGPWTLMLPE